MEVVLILNTPVKRTSHLHFQPWLLPHTPALRYLTLLKPGNWTLVFMCTLESSRVRQLEEKGRKGFDSWDWDGFQRHVV